MPLKKLLESNPRYKKEEKKDIMENQKTRTEQITEGLQRRIDQINEWRNQQLGYLTSLYVNEHVSSDQ